MNYIGSIIQVRKLKHRPQDQIEAMNFRYTHLQNRPANLYSNYPMVRRANNKIIKVFGNHFYITWGWPISIHFVELGWKTKFDSVRFEWCPQFSIFFFGFQFCIHWTAPIIDGKEYPDNDKYYEMILSYLNYYNKDIVKTEKNWGWVDGKTKKSTWNKNYLVNI